MLQGELSAILSTFIKLTYVIKIFVLSIFEWPFNSGFTVSQMFVFFSCVMSYDINYSKCTELQTLFSFCFQIICSLSGLKFTKCLSKYQTGKTLIRLTWVCAACQDLYGRQLVFKFSNIRHTSIISILNQRYSKKLSVRDSSLESGDKNISILHLSCKTSDLQFSLGLHTHARVL